MLKKIRHILSIYIYVYKHIKMNQEVTLLDMGC